MLFLFGYTSKQADSWVRAFSYIRSYLAARKWLNSHQNVSSSIFSQQFLGAFANSIHTRVCVCSSSNTYLFNCLFETVYLCFYFHLVVIVKKWPIPSITLQVQANNSNKIHVEYGGNVVQIYGSQTESHTGIRATTWRGGGQKFVIQILFWVIIVTFKITVFILVFVSAYAVFSVVAAAAFFFLFFCELFGSCLKRHVTNLICYILYTRTHIHINGLKNVLLFASWNRIGHSIWYGHSVNVENLTTALPTTIYICYTDMKRYIILLRIDSHIILWMWRCFIWAWYTCNIIFGNNRLKYFINRYWQTR